MVIVPRLVRSPSPNPSGRWSTGTCSPAKSSVSPPVPTYSRPSPTCTLPLPPPVSVPEKDGLSMMLTTAPAPRLKTGAAGEGALVDGDGGPGADVEGGPAGISAVGDGESCLRRRR